MKRIIENWNKFVINEISMKKLDIQQERISISKKIHNYLMQPTVNIGDKYDMKPVWDEEGNMTEVPMGKEDSTFLLYLYKGFDEFGKLSNEQNVGAVNSQIKNRVDIFIDQLTGEQQLIFKQDSDNIIEYIKQRRTYQEEENHLTKYIAKKAPGQFNNMRFAGRWRALYSDTNIHGGNPDFMFKTSPELKNIPPEHHFLFSIENLIGRAANSITDIQSVPNLLEIPELTGREFFTNYIEGITVEQRNKEEDLFRPIYQRGSVDKFMTNLETESLRFFYQHYDDEFEERLRNEEGLEEEFSNFAKSNITDIIEYTSKIIKKLRPENFLRLLYLIDNNYIPKKYYAHVDKDIQEFRKILDFKNYYPMSHYEIIYPLNPEEVPQEEQIHPEDVAIKKQQKLQNFRRSIGYVAHLIKKNLEIRQEDLDKIENTYALLEEDQVLEAKLMMVKLKISKESISKAILKYRKSQKNKKIDPIVVDTEEEAFDPALEAGHILDEIIWMLEDGEEIDSSLIEEYNEYYKALNKAQRTTLIPKLQKINKLNNGAG
jgi:hypothetical protein